MKPSFRSRRASRRIGRATIELLWSLACLVALAAIAAAWALDRMGRRR